MTDGQMDGQTDILPRHSPRYAYASRGRNVTTHRAVSIQYKRVTYTDVQTYGHLLTSGFGITKTHSALTVLR